MLTTKPLHNFVLIRKLEDCKVSKGGVIIPGKVNNPLMKGLVLDIGPGILTGIPVQGERDMKRVPISVKTGDTVLFKTINTYVVGITDDEFLVPEQDVIGVVIDEQEEAKKTMNKMAAAGVAKKV